MSSERKLCGCLVQSSVMNAGNIITRTDYCSAHGKEMNERSDREWEERKPKK